MSTALTSNKKSDIIKTTWRYRLARSRTSPSHGEDTGSNPVSARISYYFSERDSKRAVPPNLRSSASGTTHPLDGCPGQQARRVADPERERSERAGRRIPLALFCYALRLGKEGVGLRSNIEINEFCEALPHLNFFGFSLILDSSRDFSYIKNTLKRRPHGKKILLFKGREGCL